MTTLEIKEAILKLRMAEQQYIVDWLDKEVRSGWLDLTSGETHDRKAPESELDEDRLLGVKDQLSFTPREVRAYYSHRFPNHFDERELSPVPYFKKNCAKILVGLCPFHKGCTGKVTVQVHFSGYFETTCPLYIQEHGLHGGSLYGFEQMYAGGTFLEARERVQAVLSNRPLEIQSDKS